MRVPPRPEKSCSGLRLVGAETVPTNRKRGLWEGANVRHGVTGGAKVAGGFTRVCMVQWATACVQENSKLDRDVGSMKIASSRPKESTRLARALHPGYEFVACNYLDATIVPWVVILRSQLGRHAAQETQCNASCHPDHPDHSKKNFLADSIVRGS